MIKLVLGFVLSYGVLRGVQGALRWFNRIRVVRQLEAARQAPGSPELEASRPYRIFQAPEPAPVELLLDTALQIGATAASIKTNRLLAPEIVKVENIADEWWFVAMRHAADTRGLKYLPPRARDPLTLHLAREHMTIAGAPAEAFAYIDARLQEVGTGQFYSRLFNSAVLRDVDQTPSVFPEIPTYFTKYFQPLMVSFAEETFRTSPGGGEDPREALLEHLVHLSSGRVAAARIAVGAPPPDPGLLTKKMARAVPGGMSRGPKIEAKKWNQDDAVMSVLLVADPKCGEMARAIEARVETRTRQCSKEAPHMVWTSEIEKAESNIVLLWQRR